VTQESSIIYPPGYQHPTPPAMPPLSTSPSGRASTEAFAPDGHITIGPYEFGPLEVAELMYPENDTFKLIVEGSLMIEKTAPAVQSVSNNGRQLVIGHDPNAYKIQLVPGIALLRAPGAPKLVIAGRRLLKQNGQPYVQPAAPPAFAPIVPPAPMPIETAAPPEPPQGHDGALHLHEDPATVVESLTHEGEKEAFPT
jgi:hypothetical protein